MTEETTNVAGIEIPSTDPIFLAVVGVHILLGLACTVTGAIAMLSQKRAGRHPRYGTIYFWCLAGVFLTATGLAHAISALAALAQPTRLAIFRLLIKQRALRTSGS